MPAGCQFSTGSTSSYLGSHTHPARSQMRAGTLCAADCLTDSSGAGGRGFSGALTRNKWCGGVGAPGLGCLVQLLWWHKHPFLGLHLRWSPWRVYCPAHRLECFYLYPRARLLWHFLPPHTGACDTAIAPAPLGTGCWGLLCAPLLVWASLKGAATPFTSRNSVLRDPQQHPYLSSPVGHSQSRAKQGMEPPPLRRPLRSRADSERGPAATTADPRPPGLPRRERAWPRLQQGQWQAAAVNINAGRANGGAAMLLTA